VDEGESLKVSDMTYLFTDLKRSTPLYESVGDVNAYFLVRQHFEILNKIIRERSGTIIKTIGDAVMAGFERPQDAVRASIEMIEELSRFNRTASRPLGLKVGVHRGRAIAVTLNDRIDYFGQDVNIAAIREPPDPIGKIKNHFCSDFNIERAKRRAGGTERVIHIARHINLRSNHYRTTF
jgi:class 3 adenylate cyclase